MTYVLKIWVLCIIPAIVVAGACERKGVCQARQLGSPRFKTRLLQCSSQSCSRAIFAPSPSEVCLIRSSSTRTGNSAVRISLSSCVNVSKDKGYVLNGTGDVISWKSGVQLKSSLFSDTSCETLCNAIDCVLYKSSGGMLIADRDEQIGISRAANCQQALYVYPNVIPSGACGESASTVAKRCTSLCSYSQAPKKQCPSRTRQRALLTLTDGDNTMAVGSPVQRDDGSYHLPITEERNGAVFYVQSYISEAVGALGTVESVTAYTLQLVSSGKYLVADELNDTTLKYSTCGSTGLSLEHASAYSGGYVQKPDNRLFIRYVVTAYNRSASFFCPLFHRKLCLFPTDAGYVLPTFLRGSSGSLEPTFNNPADQELQNYLRPPCEGGETRLLNLKIL